MGLIIKQDVLSCIVNDRLLQKFDFTKQENFLPLKLTAIGIAAEGNIIEFRRKGELSLNDVKRFLKDCHLITIGISEKTFERSLNGFFSGSSWLHQSNINPFKTNTRSSSIDVIRSSSDSFLLAYHFKSMRSCFHTILKDFRGKFVYFFISI